MGFQEIKNTMQDTTDIIILFILWIIGTFMLGMLSGIIYYMVSKIL